MAKAVSTQKAGISEADLLATVKNDPAASRNQVPPGQTAQPEPQAELKPPTETQPVANNPEASRNQIPPGQASPTPQGVATSMAGNTDVKPEPVRSAALTGGYVQRDPTDAEIGAFLARRFPGVTLEDIQDATARRNNAFLQNPSAHPAENDKAGLLRKYGPGYITATVSGPSPEIRYFTQTTWKNMSPSDKEKFSQVVKEPPEVTALKNRQ